MPYYINHTDGTSLVTVQDGEVDNTATTISLVGKNFPTYGQVLNQNLVTMLENSAGASPPDSARALLGQLWYDSADKSLKLRREGSTAYYWQKLAMTTEGSTAPTDARVGDLWWDTTTSQLKLYDPTLTDPWSRIIGPQTTSEGLISVNGNNSFILQVGGNNVFTVDNTGGANLPRNPCVFGYNYYNTTSDLSSSNSFLIWNPIVSINNGDCFTQSTGVFKVKTAGVYEVYAHVTTLGGPYGLTFDTPEGNVMQLQWQLRGVDANINATNNHTTLTQQQLVCHGLISAAKNDEIQLVYKTATGCSISYASSSYSIRLVG
jgi:hypothetical protein